MPADPRHADLSTTMAAPPGHTCCEHVRRAEGAMESEPLSVEARARVEQRHVRQPGGTCFACGQHWPCDASQVVATIRQAEAARASLRSRLDEVEAAAQEVADVAFAVCQRQTVGTPLHKPMQALIDVLAAPQDGEYAGGIKTVRPTPQNPERSEGEAR